MLLLLFLLLLLDDDDDDDDDDAAVEEEGGQEQHTRSKSKDCPNRLPTILKPIPDTAESEASVSNPVI